MTWVLDRLGEESTYRGLIQVAGSLGLVSVDPTLANAIIGACLGLVGIINFVKRQRAV